MMTKKARQSAYVILSTALLASCQLTGTDENRQLKTVNPAVAETLAEMQQGANTVTVGDVEVPDSVQQELMGLNDLSSGSASLSETRFAVNASDVPARDFFAALVADSENSVVVHPDVEGAISLSLKDVTLSETLEVLSDVYGYDIRKTGQVYRVYPAGLRTETLVLDYLFIQRFGLSSTNVNSGGVSDEDSDSGSSSNSSGGNNTSFNSSNDRSDSRGSNSSNSNSGSDSSGINIQTRSETDFWSDVEKTLTKLIGDGEGRSVIVSPQTGLVTVRAYPEEIRAVQDFIDQSELHLQRQVILEAKILEVTLDDEYAQGIQWDSLMAHIGDTDFDLSVTSAISNTDLTTALGGITSISFLNKDFSGVVTLLDTQGDVQTLSSPRVTASNNQKAVIKVGQDEYFVTDVSSTTVTGTATTTTPEIDLTPFFSGIALDVTPQIDEDGVVTLHVHPSITDTNEQEKSIRLNDQELILPLAKSVIRETDTVIRARSGEIVVIGGLMQSMTVENESKTPLLGDIPFIGELFKQKFSSTKKKELVILLKPTVVEASTWQEQLQRSKDLLERWLPAGG